MGLTKDEGSNKFHERSSTVSEPMNHIPSFHERLLRRSLAYNLHSSRAINFCEWSEVRVQAVGGIRERTSHVDLILLIITLIIGGDQQPWRCRRSKGAPRRGNRCKI